MTATTLDRVNEAIQETVTNGREGAHEPACGQAAQAIDPELESRVRRAAARYLEMRGYEVLERDWLDGNGPVDIVCRDEDGTLVFVEVQAALGSFPAECCLEAKRALFEALAMAYLQEYEYVDVTVRFDSICMVPVGESRAFLRHQVNALGTM